MFLRRHRERSEGQAMVEFALILPIALLILLGIIQFGFLFAGHIGVTNAVRETARYGSTSAVNDATTATANAGQICTYLKNTAMTRVPGYSSSNVVTSGSQRTTVEYESYTDPHAAPNTWSVRLTVHVEYKHPLLVPIVGAIIDGMDGANDSHFQLGATEAMRVENPILTTDPSLNTTVNCP